MNNYGSFAGIIIYILFLFVLFIPFLFKTKYGKNIGVKRFFKIIITYYLGFIFPFILNIIFMDIEVGFFYIIYIVSYLLFWIIPILYFNNQKNIILKLFFVNLFIFSFYLYLSILYGDYLLSPIANLNSDNHLNGIKNNIIGTLSKEEKFNFTNIQEFINTYPASENWGFEGFCFYLSSIDNGEGYLLAYKYYSKEYIKKYGKDYFLYKSIPDYKITTEEMAKIQETINKDCLK